MKIANYNPQEVETEILQFWDEQKIYDKSVSKNKKGKKFHFIDGPPYTSGAIHVGHALNKALKDSFLRYKRMQGFSVWDRPGYDMHGLPIEVQVEKKLGIQNKQEILQKLGLKKFIEECESFAMEQMWPMIKDFKRMGVWLNWKDPYLTLKTEYIEAAWWALKKAQENGYLYLGEKAMTWCPRCATALAKHELVYSNETDLSIFVKFKVLGKENEYLIIWTTTPWTIPFNLAVMANPQLEYIRAKVKEDSGKEEIWICAKALQSFIPSVANKKFETVQEFLGDTLEGLKYVHPLEKEILQCTEFRDKELDKNPKVHTVLMSTEYVDTSAGTGLVHCAPGCGPEDYEVGRRNKIAPFNELNEHGEYKDTMGIFSGLVAKKDDVKFIEILKKVNAVVGENPVEHEYAHCWRCKTSVVYKTTDQWFLAVEKLKKEMIESNKKVFWNPDWAGQRQFHSWLTDLQDWCISRQRFWGIPLPIWKCDTCEKTRLIESGDELRKLSKKKIDDLHRPFVDEITFACSCNGTMNRIPDVLDVWMDSGAAPWATLGDKKDYENVVADFILEGKDQIRGWFNSLICLSMVARKKSSYKAVYMHGMINDSQGRKMSKSLKNTISPYEVIDQYGADTMRYYMISGSAPGMDLNYNFEDMKLKSKNISVFWNMHKFIIEYASSFPKKNLKISQKKIGIEEKYILSRLHSTIAEVTECYESYKINEVPTIVEEFLLDISRTYIQIIREKSVFGTDDEKQSVLAVLFTSFFEGLKMFAVIAPLVSEKMYLQLQEAFGSKEKMMQEESIHLFNWPKADELFIDNKLEENFSIAQNVMQGILFAREKAQLGVRWPVKEVTLVTQDEIVKRGVKALEDAILSQTNIKILHIKEDMSLKKTVKPDYAKIGPAFGNLAPKIIGQIAIYSQETIISNIEKSGSFALKIDNETVEIKKEHLLISREVPAHLVEVPVNKGFIYLNKERTKELDSEGFSREVTRRIQSFRKDIGLEKKDIIDVIIVADKEIIAMLDSYEEQMKEKVGALKLDMEEKLPKQYQHTRTEKIKDKAIEIHVNVRK